MPFTYKILGQSAPTASTYTKAYTVPAATSAIVSTLTIANRSGNAGVFRVFVCPSSQTAATPANSQALFVDTILDANSSNFVSIGATLATGDYVSVWTNTSDFAFSVFGTEIT
jgi:hypothetical protein